MQLFANNADSSLNGAIASDTLVLTLKAGEGSKFPSPSNGDYFLVTLYQKLGSGEINHEIVKCTSRTGDDLTVVRAQEGTSAKSFNSGDLVELRFTKGTAENFPQLDDLAIKEPVIAAPVSAPTEKYWRGDKTWRNFFTDVRAATLTGLSTATNAVVLATDTVLAAIGKLQAQMSAKFDSSGGDISGSVTVLGDLLATGNVLATSGVLGYGEGAGGTTQQSESVTTPVSLNTPNGVITLMNDYISAGGRVEFALYNSFITADSIVIAHGVYDGTALSIKYLTVRVEYVEFGRAVISVKNIRDFTAFTNSVKIRFVVFAGSNS